MDFERQVVFELFGLPVTTTVVTTWAMILVLALVGIILGRRIQRVPSAWQSALEWGVSAIGGMIAETTGKSRWLFLPLTATLGLFIIVANTLAVLPLVEAPTADVNTPIALALIVFFSIPYFGMQEMGPVGYLKTFMQPIPLLFPINVIHYFSRTLSLAIRLFGNMVSHQVIVAIVLVILPLLVPVVLEIFGLLIGLLQAYIFVVLTVVYLGGAVQADEGI